MSSIKIDDWGESAGAELRGIRAKNRISQKEMAKKMQVSQQTLSKRELDARSMTLEEVVMACGILNCTFEITKKGVVVL